MTYTSFYDNQLKASLQAIKEYLLQLRNLW